MHKSTIALLVGMFIVVSTSNAEQMQKEQGGSDQSDVRPLFFQRLREVADNGDLFDPLSISKILGIDFQIDTSEEASDCAQVWESRSFRTTQVTADTSSWYRVLASGAGSMEVPAAFINPATKTGDAKFSYKVMQRIDCTDRFRLQDHTEAKLSFSGLPSFACITGWDIERLLPNARFEMATDGVSLYRYQGKLDDDASTSIEFWFRMGAQCALSVSVNKDQQNGLRYQRADSKRRNCEVGAYREFCAIHEPFGWGDGAALDEMSLYADMICGTTDSLYKNDFEHGVQPKPLPKPKNGVATPPCQVYDQ